MEDSNLSFYGGSEVILIPIIELLALFIFCLYLLWGYADKKRSNYFVQFVTFIGWFLSFSLIVFIPLDIYLSHK
jgi:hypothetical protein